MHADDAVVDLAATAQPLSANTDRVCATFDDAGLVEATDRQPMGVLLGDDFLQVISDALFIPLDRFEETL